MAPSKDLNLENLPYRILTWTVEPTFGDGVSLFAIPQAQSDDRIGRNWFLPVNPILILSFDLRHDANRIPITLQDRAAKVSPTWIPLTAFHEYRDLEIFQVNLVQSISVVSLSSYNIHYHLDGGNLRVQD